MQLHLRITGILLILLAFLHLIFPKYFSWKKELPLLSLVNRQLMYVHTFFIALMLFLMGILCLSSTTDILSTRLGHQLSLGLFVFWFTRLIFQFFVYSRELWKGKRFESIVHLIFSAIWIYFTLVFFFVFYQAGFK